MARAYGCYVAGPCKLRVVTHSESLFELGHFILGPDGDANPIRPHRPSTANVDFLLRHVFEEVLSRSLHVHHETVCFRRNKLYILSGQLAKSILAYIGVDFAALCHEILHL